MDLVSEIKKIPPVTRFLCLAMVGVTGGAKLGMLDLYWVFYETYFVLKKLQVWRIYSCFFVGKCEFVTFACFTLLTWTLVNLSFIFELIML